jgi:CBS domain-containing protein
MGSTPLVSSIEAIACSRMATIARDAMLIDVAKLLTQTQIDLVVVCNPDSSMVGVITKSDVVRQIGHCAGGACQTAAADVMTQQVTFCRASDRLADVLLTMQTQGLVHLPVIDGDRKPVGVVNARDALRLLMMEGQYEESLLRNYVMGIGYQ